MNLSSRIFRTLFCCSIYVVALTIILVWLHHDGSDSDDVIIAQSAEKYGHAIVAKVVNVHDGDTLNVDIAGWPAVVGSSMPVRINGIDTPEISSHDRRIKSLAVKARDYVRKRVDGGKVIELRNIGRDKYFRLNADLVIDGVDISKELLRLGLAKPYDGGTKMPWDSK